MEFFQHATGRVVQLGALLVGALAGLILLLISVILWLMIEFSILLQEDWISAICTVVLFVSLIWVYHFLLV